MQCRRARLPEVDEPVDRRPSCAAPGGLVVADPDGVAGRPSSPAPPGGEWLVVVGPEGGLRRRRARPRSGRRRRAARPSGPHVLRAETAAVAVAAVLAGRAAAVRLTTERGRTPRSRLIRRVALEPESGAGATVEPVGLGLDERGWGRMEHESA